MSNLLIGHVTPASARVWVRGDRKKKQAVLRYRERGASTWLSATADLEASRGYVHVFELVGLEASTAYETSLAFKPGGTPSVRTGGFTTAPGGPRDVSFLLASCNWTRAPLDILDPDAAWRGIESLVASLAPDFMIHCGDQIYSDVPTSPPPEFMDVRYFREQYVRAWKIQPTARVLASLPHYMILDDHEIFNDYYTGKPYGGASDTQALRGAALTAYKEYQHCHNPQPFALPALYCSWSWGGAQFFALDVRTERYVAPHNQMIGSQQMEALKRWLEANAGALKFVITSVPFVGETRSPADKWSGADFLPQREEIVDFLAARPQIERLVFLTGDMHCSYHATMQVTRQDGTRLVVHELMSSPINQFCSGFSSFLAHVERRTGTGVAYAVDLREEEFYGRHSNVMRIEAAASGRISWDVYRTKGVEIPPVPVLAGQAFSV